MINPQEPEKSGGVQSGTRSRGIRWILGGVILLLLACVGTALATHFLTKCSKEASDSSIAATSPPDTGSNMLSNL